MACARIGGEGFGASKRGERAREAAQGCGASARERAPGACAIEQRVSATRIVSSLPQPTEPTGVGQRLSRKESQSSFYRAPMAFWKRCLQKPPKTGVFDRTIAQLAVAL